MKHCPSIQTATRTALETFAALLLRWNRTVNLIARRDEPTLWDRHIEDSLQLIPLLPPNLPRAVDLGSGAGFPGLILAIATAIPFDLIEADQRKAAFLREAARLTNATATIHATRIEATNLPPAPLITARALAPLPALLALTAPKLAPNGICLFLKGANATSELTAAAAQWHMRTEQHPSRTNPTGCILRISEIARATPIRDRDPT
ncbi:MAG: 16S rRNA (guanine(527)-N(7))-methyltransferase RsmG [Acetobacteraceae bacterium]|nr:16S rRNA (guanine(527)-N(7))-methyltransferase RsmG [Acetobacteraceae bacterium]MSP29243.1 16S rRNA (guanine(527)-N(7))-methyltransferase RsmG [Acetobacteraceae bacterium]